MASSGHDCSWRWQTGGLAALEPGQAADAQAVFDTWLRRCNSFSLGGTPVDSLGDFVGAIQSAPSRTCGLEGCVPSAEFPDGPESPARGQAVAGAMALSDALASFLLAYQAFDGQFERIKADGVLFAPLEMSREALALDRAAWALSGASMAAAAGARRAGARLCGSPLRHPFLVARTLRYVQALMVLRPAPEEPPPCPFAGDPSALDAAGRAVAAEWVARYAEADDAVRRAREAEGAGHPARAEMMRWLDGIGRLEEAFLAAEEAGTALSASGTALSRAQRADLRSLRAEMTAMHAASNDISHQAAAVRRAQAGPDAELLATERKVMARLEEMRGHHKSRAAFHWVRSFHFERAAQAEAELLAPRLVAAVRAEIEQDVSQSSGDVGVFLTGKTARERAAVGAMADASQALSATAEAKAARHPASMTGLAMALVGSIVAAGKALGADFLGDMRAILPALAGQANRMIEATKPTPAENLQKKVPDWRIEGIAVADRRMRRAADCPAQMSARQTLVGYARAVADDGGLMAKVRGADPACAAWIEKVSGRAGQAGARTAGQPAARTAAAPAAAAHGFH